ncbi:MAG: hypothetical protein L0H63_15750 [Nitrococcus sp.]|nr:hypothetical protein [Nitrococcus sp.]
MSPTSPYARLVACVLREKGLWDRVEPVRVNPLENPAGKVNARHSTCCNPPTAPTATTLPCHMQYGVRMHNCELLHRPMLAVLMTAMLTIAGCTTYGERVAPVPLPSAQDGAVEVEGARILARAFVDPKAAEQAFGFNIRSAGLLPVQIVIDNQSGQTIAVQPQQTLLIDQQGNAWPLLSIDRAEQRVQSTVAQGESIKAGAKSSLLAGLAGAVAGAAIGVVTGRDVGAYTAKGAAGGAAIGAIGGGFSRYSNVGHDIRQDMEQQSFGNAVIHEGELAHGYLFFPGKNEAETAQSLRLALRIGESTHIVNIPVSRAEVGG